jgi:hypothetical protein
MPWTCPDCEGYRHGKVGSWWRLFLNRGWCLRCCNRDGTPKPFELTDAEKRRQLVDAEVVLEGGG